MKERLERLHRETILAVRSLRRAPAFSVAAILTLALGIGAVTLTFDMLHGTLVRPLPFPEPATLDLVQAVNRETSGRISTYRWSHPWFTLLRERGAGIADIAAYGSGEINLSDDGLPERVRMEAVSPNYFRVLRVSAALGQVFSGEAGAAESTGGVVLGHDLWRRRWAGDPGIVGRTIRVDRVPLLVIGVMPPAFAGAGGSAELWFTHETASRVTFAGQLTSMERFLTLIARPAATAARASVASQLSAATAAIAAEIPDEDAQSTSTWSARVVPLEQARVRPDRRRAMLLLFGAVWFVLAVVCVNVASLQLVRAESRHREFAIRAAIGGGRTRIARLVLIESLLVAMAGGMLGALLATRGAAWALRVAPRSLPTPANDYGAVAEFVRTGSSGAVLAFAIALTGLTAFACGVALRAGRPGPAAALRVRSEGHGGNRFALAALAATQIALTLVLITGAGLFISALARSLRIETGARTESLITFWVNPTDPTFSTRDDGRTARILDAVRAVPGIASATVSRCAPLMPSCSRARLWIDGRETADPPITGRHYVDANHFATLGIPLLRGRPFTEADDAASQRVAVLSASAARMFPPGIDPIGRSIRFAPPGDTTADDWQIVGIAGDVVYWPPDAPPGPDVYTPYRQYSFASVLVIARTSVPPASLVPALRAAVATVNPDLPIHDVLTLEERARAAFAGRSFQTAFLAGFGLIALALATLGTWGLASASVGRRTGEFGVRLALGATPHALLRMVIGENLRVTLAGMTAGLILAFVCARLLRSMLDEIGSAPLIPLVLAATVLLITSFAAVIRPARRAGSTDPLVSIRSD